MANNLLVNLERLRDAIRGMRIERPRIERPSNPVAVLREMVREHFGAEADALVNGAGFREAERILDEPSFQPGGLVQRPFLLEVPEAAPRTAPRYTADLAMEEIRRVTTAQGTGDGAAAYAPAEGPTSACFQCGRNVPPADLFVGKRSGIALCEPCLEKWEKAGRAKRTGEF